MSSTSGRRCCLSSMRWDSPIWNNVYVANLIQGAATTLVVLFAFLYVRGVFGVAAALFGAFLFAFTPYFVASHRISCSPICRPWR